jgi:hypothetical protein
MHCILILKEHYFKLILFNHLIATVHNLSYIKTHTHFCYNQIS